MNTTESVVGVGTEQGGKSVKHVSGSRPKMPRDTCRRNSPGVDPDPELTKAFREVFADFRIPPPEMTESLTEDKLKRMDFALQVFDLLIRVTYAHCLPPSDETVD